MRYSQPRLGLDSSMLARHNKAIIVFLKIQDLYNFHNFRFVMNSTRSLVKLLDACRKRYILQPMADVKVKLPAVLRAMSEMQRDDPDYKARMNELKANAAEIEKFLERITEGDGFETVLKFIFTKDHYLRLLAASEEAKNCAGVVDLLGRLVEEHLPPAPQEFWDVVDLIYENENAGVGRR